MHHTRVKFTQAHHVRAAGVTVTTAEYGDYCTGVDGGAVPA